MIVGLLRVKNEARWIAEVLRSIKPVCHRLVVFDDHSTDETAAICKAEGALVLASPFEGLAEMRDKEYLLTNAGLDVGDWVVWIDGDEVLHPQDRDLIQQEMTSGRAPAFSLRILYLWDSREQMRVDRRYGTFWRPSMFQYKPGMSFLIRSEDANRVGFHCSNVPHQAIFRCEKSDVRLLHLGYMNREDRIRKWHDYNQKDPNNRLEDYYRHMVQGDVPEVPADAVLKHAGPLQLQPI